MGSTFGDSSHMGRWSDDERRLFGQAVQEYKRLRPYFGGRRYLLTDPLHQDWEVWQFVSRTGAEFALLAFRETGQITGVRVTPRAISEDRSYLVQRSGSDPAVRISGTDLIAGGLAVELPEPRSSELIWVTAEREPPDWQPTTASVARQGVVDEEASPILRANSAWMD